MCDLKCTIVQSLRFNWITLWLFYNYRICTNLSNFKNGLDTLAIKFRIYLFTLNDANHYKCLYTFKNIDCELSVNSCSVNCFCFVIDHRYTAFCKTKPIYVVTLLFKYFLKILLILYKHTFDWKKIYIHSLFFLFSYQNRTFKC